MVLLAGACSPISSSVPFTTAAVTAREWELHMEEPPATGEFWSFVLTNEGRELHEFGIAALPPDTPAEDIVAQVRATGEIPPTADPLAVVGPVEPGRTMQLDSPIPLEWNRRYIFACFLRVEEGPDRGRLHAELGMFGEFRTMPDPSPSPTVFPTLETPSPAGT
jgi:hypothetical protein